MDQVIMSEWGVKIMNKPEVVPPLSNTPVRDIYTRRFGGEEDRRQQVWTILSEYYFQKWVHPEDTVLDLGSGYCEFINSIQAKCKIALDLNPDMRKRANPGIEVLTQDVSQSWPVADASVDVVFTSNFLEHLPTKDMLSSCIRETHRILRPGGRFILLGPNIRFAYDVYWDFFDHYLALSDRSLVEVLELNGFTSEIVVPRFLPFTMAGRTVPHSLLIRLYLASPVLWRFFGKQFFIVASRNTGTREL
jgi:SAM-dependent methyltransferase